MKKLIVFIGLGILSCAQTGQECEKVSFDKSEIEWFEFITRKSQVVYRNQSSAEIVFEKLKNNHGYTACNTFEIGPNQFEYVSVQQKMIAGSVADRNKKYDVKQRASDQESQIDLYFFDFWVSFNLKELSTSDCKKYSLDEKEYQSYRLSSRKGSQIDSLYWSPNIGVVAFKYQDSYFTLQ